MVMVAATPGCIRHAAVPRARTAPVVAVGLRRAARRVLAVVRRNGIQPRTEREVVRRRQETGALRSPRFLHPHGSNPLCSLGAPTAYDLRRLLHQRPSTLHARVRRRTVVATSADSMGCRCDHRRPPGFETGHSLLNLIPLQRLSVHLSTAPLFPLEAPPPAAVLG